MDLKIKAPPHAQPSPKLLLRSKGNSTEFTQLVNEAVAVAQRLGELQAPRASRLTAEALLRETLAVVGSTKTKVLALRKALDRNELGLEDAQRTARRMRTFLVSPNWAGPPANAERLRFLWTPATLAELSPRGYTGAELFCVAVLIQADRQPECFGECTDSAAHSAEVARLTKRQSALQTQISKAWRAEDIDIEPLPGPDHACSVTVKLSHGAVPLGPIDNLGERLVGHLLAKARG